MPIVLPLDSPSAPLQLVGGKGRCLATLAASGMPVPSGFLIATNAYDDFVESNGLQARILDYAENSEAARFSDIKPLFSTANLPAHTARAISTAYADLRPGEPSVAVRSSATAEDLPEFSFAGQQDTFLNVRGEAALLRAIRDCWASLWTPRAIEYRERMNVSQHAVSMGVVVQLMVDAEVSGILFYGQSDQRRSLRANHQRQLRSWRGRCGGTRDTRQLCR